MPTILKVLEAAEYILKQGTVRPTAMDQLHNVIVLLRKGYGANADFADILGDHAGVEQVPEKGGSDHQKKRTTVDKRILLEALITEREGMMAENTDRVTTGEGLAFVDTHFDLLANRMRVLTNDASAEECRARAVTALRNVIKQAEEVSSDDV